MRRPHLSLPPLLMAALAAMLLPPATPAAGAEYKKVHGTTSGLLVDDPQWSAGVALGNYGGTGVTAQQIGYGGGAVDLGLGFGYGDLWLIGDWIMLLDEDFRRLDAPPKGGYNALRGRLMPYIGGGAAVGDGLGLRLPAGLQYTMLKDPFNFFGGVALMVGPFLSDHKLGINLWFSIGARALL